MTCPHPRSEWTPLHHEGLLPEDPQYRCGRCGRTVPATRPNGRPLAPYAGVATMLKRWFWRTKKANQRARRAGQQRPSSDPFFAPVACPRCGDTFGGKYPRRGYASHRAQACPWSSDAERATFRVENAERRRYLTNRSAVRLAVRRLVVPRHGADPMPHVGHEFFEQARELVPGDSENAFIQDRRSAVVLALLEGRDPVAALRAERSSQLAWESRLNRSDHAQKLVYE